MQIGVVRPVKRKIKKKKSFKHIVMILVPNVANISIKLCTKFQSGTFTIKKVRERIESTSAPTFQGQGQGFKVIKNVVG